MSKSYGLLLSIVTRKDDPAVAECWEWPGAVSSTGYGKVRFDGRCVSTHRIAYARAKGPIPAGLTIDHLCRNRRCVRPSHLEAVPSAENVRRGTSPAAANARKTYCAHGHPYDAANTKFRKGGRDCRTCARDKERRFRETGSYR